VGLEMKIDSASFVKSSPRVEDCPSLNLPEYAFIGRSNVGKSSLINKLTNQSKLAKTSSTPGKTQLINHFLINKSWYLVDLPGYGYAKMPLKEKVKMEQMISNYLTKRKNLMNIYLLIDSRHSPMEIDLKFMENLFENQLAFSIVFTKSDKNKASRLHQLIHSYKEHMKQFWVELPPIFVTSSKTGEGTENILGEINNIVSLYNR
jgi:GTP-binding protein